MGMHEWFAPGKRFQVECDAELGVRAAVPHKWKYDTAADALLRARIDVHPDRWCGHAGLGSIRSSSLELPAPTAHSPPAPDALRRSEFGSGAGSLSRSATLICPRSVRRDVFQF